MNNKPKVTVVIPVYNVETYIHECIQSVLRQTLKNIEIICVDDGSTDNCPAILDEYARQDDRIKVIHKPNSGYGHTINVGMDAAQGEYFAIVESDDLIHPQMYESLYAIADTYHIDIVKGDFYRFGINPNGVMEKKKEYIAGDGMYNRVLDANQDREMILKNAKVYTWSGIYLLDFLRRNNIRHNETPGASYQDNGFWFQTMSLAESMYFFKKPFYYLRRDNPNSSVYNKKKVYCICEEFDFILARLKDHPDKYHELIPFYWKQLFGAYMFSFNRIGEEYKDEFLERFQKTLSIAKQNGELQKRLYNNGEWNDLQLILAGKYRAIIKKKNERKKKNPNAWQRLMWCYEDNGLGYTIKHIVRRIQKKVFPAQQVVKYEPISRKDYYNLYDEIHSAERDIVIRLYNIAKGDN